jgi:hypothetical protein
VEELFNRLPRDGTVEETPEVELGVGAVEKVSVEAGLESVLLTKEVVCVAGIHCTPL